MNARKVWCAVCNKMVEAGIEEAAASFVLPALGGLAGGALGGRRSGGGGLLGLMLGVAVGAAAHAMIPKAQRLVCGECRTHLA
jgi:hypothetical protein